MGGKAVPAKRWNEKVRHTKQGGREWKGEWGCSVTGTAQGAWGREEWVRAGSRKLVNAF